MGIYVNPSNGESKEQWLINHRSRVSRTPIDFKEARQLGGYPVCLVNNGLLTAARVGFNEGETKEFARECGRQKIWYLVPDKAFLSGSGLSARELKLLGIALEGGETI